MRSNRFLLLLRALRFDNSDNRVERKKVDKLAPIRDVWETINNKFSEFYILNECATIEEMMFAFRGRCSFKQYIPSKPDRYGLKAFALIDAYSFYTKKLELYAGNQPIGPFSAENKPSLIVKRVAQPIFNSSRNITMDNWFSSVPSVDELQKKYRTTGVAILRKNKADNLPEFVNTKGRAPCSSLFGYRNQQVLVSYVSKKIKMLYLYLPCIIGVKLTKKVALNENPTSSFIIIRRNVVLTAWIR